MPPSSAALTGHRETKRLMSEPLSPQHNEQPLNSGSLFVLIEKLRRFFLDQHIETYLVGGGLRDLLRGQPPQDFDLAIQGEAIPTARRLADTLGGSFAALRQEKGVARVILPAPAHTSLVIDIAAIRNNEEIIGDLARRDFTINALALRLEDIPPLPDGPALSSWNPQPVLIDPFHGLHDLQQHILRAVQAGIFHDDPLRLLRAIRIAHRLQFRLARSTSVLLHRDAPLLILSAPERIRDELLSIINLPDAGAALQMLDNYHLLPALFPGLYGSATRTALIDTTETKKEVRWKTFTCLSHLLRAFQGASIPLSADEQEVFSRFSNIHDEPAFKERWQSSQHNVYPRATLLTLAALLFDLLPAAQDANLSSSARNQPPAESLLQAMQADLQRLALGRQATDFIILLLRHSHVPWQFAPLPESGSVRQWSAGRQYFQRYGEPGIDLAVFCLACHPARQESLSPNKTEQGYTKTLIALLDAYYHAYEELIPPALIDGQVILASLGIPPGPLVGMLLAEVRNAQLDGAIQTREEALALLKDRAAQTGK
jgi:poly(A) polymerase